MLGRGGGILTDDELRALLQSTTTIAVVGCSTSPAKAAHRIPAGLLAAGYRIVPVHPSAQEVLGQPAYRRLADVPGRVDLVDVFRPALEAPSVAEEAAGIGAPALWLQLGLVSEEARAVAERSGMTYVEDRCLGVEVERLGVHPPTWARP